MAAEGGNDSQQRRRRRRDPEEPEKTEPKESELAAAAAMARENEEDSEERWVGPLPVEATLAKKRKVLEFERVYLDNLPSASMYERSYMHRDVITHVVCTKTDFIITASHDGHVKFWKKVEEGIEFVKHFRSHLGVIESIAVSSEGALFCSVGDDKAMKVFDVVNFDMINMLKLGYFPGQCEWIYCPGDAISSVAASEKSTGKIFIYDGRGDNQPLHVFDKLHTSPLTQIRLNPVYKAVVSSDKSGMMEYWTGPPHEYKFPKNVSWEYKTDTDLYEFAKCKAYPTSICFSPDGKKIATIGSDRKVRIFRFLTGKLMRVFDESLSFTKREPEDTKSADSDRDVFNEKPSKEEVMAATQAEGPKRVSDSAIIHTSMGDIHIKLFPVECPKTVENFCVHSRNGYYNGHTFHRIIKGFMIQTGDPTGTGMGGESIWGGEFEDEFHSTLRHDRPYTLSMANAGSNTNGSQFFITVVPTPWLDNKHTVFGRVIKGMEVVQRISNVKVNPKTDKPYEDVSIINITVK
ncbi:peptidylprolyl isomerase domain and WD repeat-containing protein 1 isoform X4 [Pipistrellus kuhlii]|uniref:peptidylprolyl isomerase domain and WD repeat-containing protein 1 isoform X4 n=1 Tax=Pipistrellus kuhlii TaxID=59472 RepID=UPI00174F5D0A|nr:peptidylprolyl isomerase domain and WD repeat-containing protein 1 isoform X4 [Pipistrellus kuhlii]